MPSNSIVVDLELSKNRIAGEGVIDSVPGSLVPKPGNAINVEMELSKTSADGVVDVPLVGGTLVPKPSNSIGVELDVEVDFSYMLDSKLFSEVAGTIKEEYTESFESGTGQWINNGWSRNSGSTGSSSTGPSSAYAGSYYMYVEASNSSSADRYLTIEKSTIAGFSIEFAYHMYGSDMGSLALEGWTGSEWEEFWRKDGDQGSQWHLENVTFPSDYSKVRFHSWGASGYRGDVAIDNVKFESGSIGYTVGESASADSLALADDVQNVSNNNGINWSESIPDGTTVEKVEVEFSDSPDTPPTEWREVVNGQPIPFEAGLDFSNLYLWVRATFTTNDQSKTATVSDVKFLGTNLEGAGSKYSPPTAGGNAVVTVLPAQKPQKRPNVLPNIL